MVGALVAVLTLLMLGVVPDRMSQQARQNLDRTGSLLAEVLASSTVPALDFDDSRSAEQQLQHVANASDVVWTAVWRADGSRLAASGPAPDIAPVSALSDELAVFSRPVIPPSGEAGLAAVALSLHDLQRQKRDNRTTIAMLAMLALGIGVSGSWLIGGRLVAPILEVVTAARRVADDDLAVGSMALHADPSWRDHPNEARQLTVAVSDMAGILSSQLHQIEEERHRAQEAEKAAIEASQAKSAFLANMSHELRTPLNAVIGYTEMLLEDAEEFGEDLQRIHHAGNHLLGLINDLLDLARIEAGQMELYPEDVDVDAVLRDLVPTVKPLIAKNQNTLTVQLADDLGILRSDARRLRQILLNLIGNAAKFTNQGTIHLDALRSGEEVYFRVRDTGIGIRPEDLERLFLPFHQADASTTKQFGGTGLGLALVRNFVSMLGGEVQVQSSVGVGSTFEIRLTPLATLP